MSKYFPTAAECGRHTIFPGVHIRTVSSATMTVSVVDLEAHAVVAEHSHPHEQVGMLLSGRLDFTVGDERRELRPGDVWVIPGGVPHKVVVLEEPARAIDIFHPVREEYR